MLEKRVERGIPRGLSINPEEQNNCSQQLESIQNVRV